MCSFILPPFSKETPNKIREGIEVSGRNTLIFKADISGYRVAIADEPIDAKVDGKHIFCTRVDNAVRDLGMMFGFTPMETFDSKKEAYSGQNGFNGCGMNLYSGNLYYPVEKCHNIIDEKILNVFFQCVINSS
jgi:hypothetical protein